MNCKYKSSGELICSKINNSSINYSFDGSRDCNLKSPLSINPVCPDGYKEYDNGNCYLQESVLPMNIKHNSCLPQYNLLLPVPQCPHNYSYSSYDNKCYLDYTTNIISECPPGYYRNNNSCYMIDKEYLPFNRQYENSYINTDISKDLTQNCRLCKIINSIYNTPSKYLDECKIDINL